MAVILYTGKPGSGKSYRCVQELLSKEINEKYFIFHNIDGLVESRFQKIERWDTYIKEKGISESVFFSKDYQVELSERVLEIEGRPICMVVDEAQEFFDRMEMGKKLYLSYHRHLGQEIRLLTHKDGNIHFDYRAVVELEYRAKFTTIFKLPMIFIYQRLSSGEGLGYAVSRKKKDIFSCYKSFNAGGKITKASPAMLILLLVMVGGLVWYLKTPGRIMDKGKQKSRLAASSGLSRGGQGTVEDEVKRLNDGIKKEQDKFTSLDEKYSYKGRFGDVVVLEDQGTGIQRRIDEINKDYKIVKVKGTSYCVLSDPAGREVTVYNKGSKSIEQGQVVMPVSQPAYSDLGAKAGGLTGRWTGN